MADSYVCSGATMRCTMGEKPAKLTVLPTRTVFLCGQPMANISDHKSMVNLAPFGRCRSLGYPATASATAAHHGHLTPMPCIHNTPLPWMNGKTDNIDKNSPALLKSCKLQCMWGGTITFVDDGQVGEGSQYVIKSNKSSVEDIQTKSNEEKGLTPSNILDGIQLALDAAGFAPGVGAIPDLLNAGIYALRGNWTDAGLSVLAAVPVIGDAAAGAKIAKKGLNIAKMAKTTQKGERVIKFSEKVSNKISIVAHNIERNVIELEPGYKGHWNKQLNKKLNPNTDYKVGDCIYKTDEKGRVRNVSAKLNLGKIDRNTYQQGKSVIIKQGTKGVDDGSHLIANMFKGSSEQINYIPMTKEINRGAWKEMEKKWQSALKEIPPKKVEVNINVLYKPASERPLGFIVESKINGEYERRIFRNRIK